MEDDELAIGIYIGETNSCAAVLRNGKVDIIPNELGQRLTPSIVSFDNENRILVGEHSLNNLIRNPKKTIYGIKRIIGKNFHEVQEESIKNIWSFDIIGMDKNNKNKRPAIKIDNKLSYFYYPEEIYSLILRKLILSAKIYLEQPIKKVVLTVPSYFNENQRKATKLAAEMAGLCVLRIINEPTAAFLAYGLDKKLDKTILDINNVFNSEEQRNKNKDENSEKKKKNFIVVFDLGGRTFDLTLLEIEDKETFNTFYSCGDFFLGGNDFDQRIIDYCLNEFCTKLNIDLSEIKKNTEAINRLKNSAVNAKIRLSSEKETSIDIDDFYKNETLHIKLTINLFEDLCNDLFNRIYNFLEKILDKCPNSIDSVKEVIIVGGATRIPRLKEIVKNFFFDIDICDSINPDEAKAYGAAIKAAELNKQGEDILNDSLLMGITPLSLGINIKNENEKIKNKGDLMSVVIPKGARIPYLNKIKYNTTLDFQETMSIGVYEGENRYVNDNHFLGKLNLLNLPKKKVAEIEVSFMIDENGILTVRASETSQGMKNEFVMNHYYGYYHNSLNLKDKYENIYNFGETLVAFLNTFEKEGNNTLGNKYFLYIKVLFESYRILIQLISLINDNDIKLIIDNSKHFLDILSTFENIDYNHYIRLLSLFVIDLSLEEKKEPFEKQKQINKIRNNILNELAIFVMELIQKKAELFLSNNCNSYRYNAKNLFQNCIKVSELFIKFENNLKGNLELKKRHHKCIEKCNLEIKKINVNSIMNLDKLKSFDGLVDYKEYMNREQLLLLLDNFRNVIQNFKGFDDPISEAKILGNIVKIKYIFLLNTNYNELIKLAESSVSLAKSVNQNLEKCKWYLEISSILQELRKNLEDYLENFVFDKINKYRQKSLVKFIEFILKEHPPINNPLKKIQSVRDALNQNGKHFIEMLSARYNLDNYPKNTKEEKIRYSIMQAISIEINQILCEFDQNEYNHEIFDEKQEDIKDPNPIKVNYKDVEMYDKWKEEIITKLKNIKYYFIIKKNYEERYLDLLKNENESKKSKNEYLFEIIYKPCYKLEPYKINKYFIQISLGLFHLKLNDITITNFSLNNIILDEEDNIKLEITEKNFVDNNYINKKENPDKLDTLYLGFILYELLYLKKVDSHNLEQVIKDIELKDIFNNNYLGIQFSQDLFELFFSHNGKNESILENLLCHYDKRYSLSKLLSSDIFLTLFENNIYNEIKKRNIKSKLFYF